MGGETKAAEFVTAVYKVHVHCGQCARDIETQFTDFQGVTEVKLDAGEGKVTVKGIAFDVEKLRVKVEKGCRKRIVLVPPPPPEEIITEVKTRIEKLTIITVKVPLHCPECAVRVREILLEHKSIYKAEANLGKNTCVVEGVIEEKKLTEYIYQRTRKHCIIDKVEKKEIIVEEKVVVKKEKEKKEVVKEVVKAVEKVAKEVVAPYFIPCTHPHFVDYSHPPWRNRCCGGAGCCSSPCDGGYGHGGYGYPYGTSCCTHTGLSGYQDTAFLHCSHPNEFLSYENPYACSVM